MATRTFVGNVHSVGEIDTSTHPRNRTRMISIELRWNLGVSRALFIADGKLGEQVMRYLTGDKVRITAEFPHKYESSGMKVYQITDVEMV